MVRAQNVRLERVIVFSCSVVNGSSSKKPITSNKLQQLSSVNVQSEFVGACWLCYQQVAPETIWVGRSPLELELFATRRRRVALI